MDAGTIGNILTSISVLLQTLSFIKDPGIKRELEEINAKLAENNELTKNLSGLIEKKLPPGNLVTVENLRIIFTQIAEYFKPTFHPAAIYLEDLAGQSEKLSQLKEKLEEGRIKSEENKESPIVKAFLGQQDDVGVWNTYTSISQIASGSTAWIDHRPPTPPLPDIYFAKNTNICPRCGSPLYKIGDTIICYNRSCKWPW